MSSSTGEIRQFETGATRNADAGRPDYEAFLSPLVIERFGEYMNKHRLQADGSLRDGDNWQKGIPLAAYMKGLWRHFLHAWQRHRGWPVNDPKAEGNIEEDLCAIIFNTQGYLHEVLKAKLIAAEEDSGDMDWVLTEASTGEDLTPDSDCKWCGCWETKHDERGRCTHCIEADGCPGYEPKVSAAGLVKPKDWKDRNG